MAWYQNPGTAAVGPGSSVAPCFVPAQLGGLQQQALPEPARAGRGKGKGPISQLQEFIQSCSQLRIPQRRTILQWEYDNRMEDNATLQFSANVAFLHNGIPHHVAGQWLPSKKNAQRQTAESALKFLVASRSSSMSGIASALQVSRLVDEGGTEDEVHLMHPVCPLLPGCRGGPRWDVTREEGGSCRAVVELCLNGMPTKLAGKACRGEAASKRDAARRVLWYLQVPGFEDFFEPDPSAPSVAAATLPAPPRGWVGDEQEEEDATHIAERKTAIMRVQNRLQQLLSKRLPVGHPVWEWEYEADPGDIMVPTLCRATARVAIFDRVIAGDWVRGQRAAQVDVAYKVAGYLDSAKLDEEAPAM